MELLLPLLKKYQAKEGYVSEKALKEISMKTGIPISKIWGAATFYAQIYTKPQGKYIIEICNSPSCYIHGSINIIKYLEKKIKLKSGQANKKFSLHIGSCIGCCYKAPAMKIGKKVYGNLTPEKIDLILKKCK